ncbi:RHS repeat domain-containing protein [Agaribacterium sp. ZY112]|uniref:RHS repeat domain-containing protein n=1 Tax=Agaribacterium sp. ZY112 TaxID=3233574 RepID=UPI0035240343
MCKSLFQLFALILFFALGANCLASTSYYIIMPSNGSPEKFPSAHAACESYRSLIESSHAVSNPHLSSAIDRAPDENIPPRLKESSPCIIKTSGTLDGNTTEIFNQVFISRGGCYAGRTPISGATYPAEPGGCQDEKICPYGYISDPGNEEQCVKQCIVGLNCYDQQQKNSCLSVSSNPIDFIDGDKYRSKSVISIGSYFPIDLVFHYTSNKGLERGSGVNLPLADVLRGVRPQAIKVLGVAQKITAKAYMSNNSWVLPSPDGLDTRLIQHQYWRHNYSYWLREEEGVYKFYMPQGDPLLFSALDQSSISDVNYTLTKNVSGFSYKVSDARNLREYFFDERGRLQEVQDQKAGAAHVLTYVERSYNAQTGSSYDIDRVTHSNGSYIEFSYDSYDAEPSEFSWLTSAQVYFPIMLTDSFGRKVDISWDKTHLGSMQKTKLITSISVPYINQVSAKRIYEYRDDNFATALTHIYDQSTSDESSKRLYAHFEYDDLGRATYSALAGGADAIRVAYTDEFNRIVTNALGKETSYVFEELNDVVRLKSVTGEPTAACQQSDFTLTYDAKGFVSQKAHNGQITNYEYDHDRGVEISRTEAVGTVLERTITTEWHPSLNRITKVIEPERTLVFHYDEDGRLVSKESLLTN